MSDNGHDAVASGDAAQLALQELVNEIIQELSAGDVEEKRLAQRLIGARKADSLTREQEAALANLAQASGASQPASLWRQAVPEEQTFCIKLSSLTDTALKELGIAVEEEQLLRSGRRMASAASAGFQTNQAPELQAHAVPTPGWPVRAGSSALGTAAPAPEPAAAPAAQHDVQASASASPAMPSSNAVEAIHLDLCHSCALHAAGIDDNGSTVAETFLQQRRYAYNTGRAKLVHSDARVWRQGRNESWHEVCPACPALYALVSMEGASHSGWGDAKRQKFGA